MTDDYLWRNAEKAARARSKNYGKASWRDRYQFGSTSKRLLNLLNVLLALRCDPTIENCFAFEEMLNAVILLLMRARMDSAAAPM
jgi:hypothetical protein